MNDLIPPTAAGNPSKSGRYQMSLDTFVAAARDTTEPEALWSLSLEFYHSRAVRMVSYHHDRGLDGRADPFIVADGFPDDWVQRYVADKLFLVDPIPEFAAHATEPFLWASIGNLTSLIETQSAYLDDLREARLGEGLGVPVFGPMGQDGYVGLGFGDMRPALASAQVRDLQCAAQMAHLVYCGFTTDAEVRSVGLSHREREILSWIARGKPNAEIVGISAHTVDTHVRRIFDKLGVTDRTTAAVKGLGAGQLHRLDRAGATDRGFRT